MPSFFSQLLDFGENLAGSNLGQVGASLIGTGIAQNAAERAAATQAGAAGRAADIATAIYNQQRGAVVHHLDAARACHRSA